MRFYEGPNCKNVKTNLWRFVKNILNFPLVVLDYKRNLENEEFFSSALGRRILRRSLFINKRK